MKGTYKIDRSDEKLEITIKHGSSLSQIAYKVFLLLFYMTVFLGAFYFLCESLMVNHYLCWLIPCGATLIIFTANTLWSYKGVEKITATKRTWTLEKVAFGMKMSKEYKLLEVKNLRLAEAGDKKSSHLIDYLTYQKGKICFDYMEKTILFADALTIADADRLIEELEQIYEKEIKILSIK
ncbi:hypothetical protein EZV73_07910 [Acidaminobacter sp. JC074]|uniref:hypothetical protein n=1 Tax=Acidaminobacter sp. JC074 TaxID=2530199 RepID=UPI001F10DAB2|nr:hypothetical protein [Acidaminobacter sp. JC074]MCH4887492.1 hypothetical protein [Acidaminobacter sp. JC074]